MMTRTTTNGLQARTLQDASRDPFDWIEGPQPGDGAWRYERIGNRLMLAIAVAAVLAMFWGAI